MKNVKNYLKSKVKFEIKEKDITKFGYTIASLMVFFGIAYVLEMLMDGLYYNTSVVDWLVDSDFYQFIMLSICIIPAFNVYHMLRNKCNKA